MPSSFKKAQQLLERIMPDRSWRYHNPELSEFSKRIDKCSISELENLAIQISEYKSDRYYKGLLSDLVLRRRRWLLNREFEGNEINTKHFMRVLSLFKKRENLLRKKADELYAELWKKWENGKNENFSDFYIEISLSPHYNWERSILNLKNDETTYNYGKIAEILDDVNSTESIFSNRIDFDRQKFHENPFTDSERKSIQCLLFFEEPRLEEQLYAFRDVPVTWGFHCLVDHTHYAVQDIIRINDIWGEVRVGYQDIFDQKGRHF